jgi:hypothetical protein
MIMRDPAEGWKYAVTFGGLMNLDAKDATARMRVMATSALNFFSLNPTLFYKDMFGPYKSMSTMFPRCPTAILLTDAHVMTLYMCDRVTDAGGKLGFLLPCRFDSCIKGRVEWDLGRTAAGLCLAAGAADACVDEQVLCRELLKEYVDEMRTGKSKAPLLIDDNPAASDGCVDNVLMMMEPLSAEWSVVAAAFKKYVIENALLMFLEVADPINIMVHVDTATPFSACSSYYLTVRATNPACTRRIAMRRLAPVPNETCPSGTQMYECLGADIVSRTKQIGAGWSRFLGSAYIHNKPYIVDEFASTDYRLVGADIVHMDERELSIIAGLLGKFLARAHMNGTQGTSGVLDWISINGGTEALHERLHRFAVAYAQQTIADHMFGSRVCAHPSAEFDVRQ